MKIVNEVEAYELDHWEGQKRIFKVLWRERLPKAARVEGTGSGAGISNMAGPRSSAQLGLVSRARRRGLRKRSWPAHCWGLQTGWDLKLGSSCVGKTTSSVQLLPQGRTAQRTRKQRGKSRSVLPPPPDSQPSPHFRLSRRGESRWQNRKKWKGGFRAEKQLLHDWDRDALKGRTSYLVDTGD